MTSFVVLLYVECGHLYYIGDGWHSRYQREGMGLLEYQAMPSLRDITHDGWLCTFTIKQQLEIPSARSWAAPVRATGTVQKRHAVRPVHHIQNHTSQVTLLPRARRVAVLGQPSRIWPLGRYRLDSSAVYNVHTGVLA